MGLRRAHVDGAIVQGAGKQGAHLGAAAAAPHLLQQRGQEGGQVHAREEGGEQAGRGLGAGRGGVRRQAQRERLEAPGEQLRGDGDGQAGGQQHLRARPSRVHKAQVVAAHPLAWQGSQRVGRVCVQVRACVPMRLRMHVPVRPCAPHTQAQGARSTREQPCQSVGGNGRTSVIKQRCCCCSNPSRLPA